MRHVVFYSWESDLDSRLGRSFIETALERAAKHIAKDESVQVEPVIDRDTAGLPDSPPIASSITDKIARCDMFVCDVSIINNGSQQRLSPNPNVLLELGYASSVLGWDHIIMVQNTAFGGPETLPFDLRGRRVVQYYLPAEANDRPAERSKLQAQLEETLRLGLAALITKHRDNKDNLLWWGLWKQASGRAATGGEVFVSAVSPSSFAFRIWIVDGARSGEVSGRAQIVSTNSAVAQIRSTEPAICEIFFRRRLSENGRIIDVEESNGCSWFHGLGATFSGSFVHDPEPLFDSGFLDELELNELGRITGKEYAKILDSLQRIGEGQSSDNDVDKVVEGSVKGLYTIKQSIIATNAMGSVWCAFIDSDVVKYFTNVQKDVLKIPKTIDIWRSGFADKPIIYASKSSVVEG